MQRPLRHQPDVGLVEDRMSTPEPAIYSAAWARDKAPDAADEKSPAPETDDQQPR
jgi:hypothetical protein